MGRRTVNIDEIERELIGLKATYEELKLAIKATPERVKAGELAVITRGVNTDRIFFCTKVTEMQVEGVFSDGSVYIGDRINARPMLADNTSQSAKYHKISEFLKDAQEI